MSLEERTLVIRNLNSQYVSKSILEELFTQAGPVLNVVLRTDFAYIEFEHKISVGYALALMDGLFLFGQQMVLEPKIRYDQTNYNYMTSMNRFNYVLAQNPNFFSQYITTETPQNTRHYPNSYNDQNEHQFRPNRSEVASNASYDYSGNRGHYRESRRYSDYSDRHQSNRYQDFDGRGHQSHHSFR